MKRTIFTEEHILFRDAFRHFVEKEMAPHNERWEKDGEVSRELWLKAGQQGFLGMSVPEEYGGAGACTWTRACRASMPARMKS